MNHKDFDEELYKEEFRVSIFGSARIGGNDREYREVYELARLLAAEGIDIVTGGGPGLMQAANKGHMDGRKGRSSQSIGLNITIPNEQHANRHLDIKKEFSRFSERLDNFMALSNVVVVAAGGVGTLLEFLYTWQLVQVKQLYSMPIILLDGMWDDFMDWIREHPLKKGLMSPEDLETIHVAKNPHDAFEIIMKSYGEYGRDDLHEFSNLKRYWEKHE